MTKSRTPTITEIEITRAIRAARKAGIKVVVPRKGATTIEIPLATHI